MPGRDSERHPTPQLLFRPEFETGETPAQAVQSISPSSLLVATVKAAGICTSARQHRVRLDGAQRSTKLTKGLTDVALKSLQFSTNRPVLHPRITWLSLGAYAAALTAATARHAPRRLPSDTASHSAQRFNGAEHRSEQRGPAESLPTGYPGHPASRCTGHST